MRRPTLPLLSIWNLVFEFSSGTLSQNMDAWASRTSKHAPRHFTITPWNYNGESPWNIVELSTVGARIVDRGTRITVRTSCSLVCCSCSRSSTASCSTASASVYWFQKCVLVSKHLSSTQKTFNYHALNPMCTVCTVCTGFFKLFTAFFKNTVFFLKRTST